MSFVAAKVALGPGVVDSLGNGILPAEAHGRLSDAKSLANKIVAQAEQDAQAIRQRAEQDVQQLIAQIHADAESQLSAALAALQEEWTGVIHDIEPLVLTLARTAVERLCLQASTEQQLNATLAMLLQALPERPVDACLYVAPSQLQAHDWKELSVCADAKLAPVQIRLETRNAIWATDFSAAVQAVTAQLSAN